MFESLSRRRFLSNTAAFGSLAFTTLLTSVAAAKDRPNILFLLTDDQRADSLGCAGNPIIQTPNIDQLAVDGVRYQNHFVTTAICMSSRASIFTGLYSRCHEIHSFSQPLTEDRFASIYPVLLRQAGYRTGFVGKWGLGGELPKDAFDYFEGFPGQGKYFHEIEGETVHLTRILGKQAEGFLDGCSREQPFCLSVSFKAPHVQDNDPRQFLYDPSLEYLYQDDIIPPPPKSSEEYFKGLPEYIQNSEARNRWQKRFSTEERYQASVKGYYRLISGVDRVVGAIRRKLKEKDLDKNTVIVFTSENGFYLGEYGLAGKWYPHEESIRVPLLIMDPRMEARKRGDVRHGMSLNIDMAPTLLALAGVEAPSSMQGLNLLPTLDGEMIPWRKEFFYEHLFEHRAIPKSEGVRTERWKYFKYVDIEPTVEELYDLEADPLETKNLAGVPEFQEQLNQMRRRHEHWVQRLDAWDGSARSGNRQTTKEPWELG